jgi:hypothetical protein
MPAFSIRPTAVLIALAIVQLAGCTASRGPAHPDVIGLGRDKIQGQCVATRGWKDKAVPDAFASSYFITCRGTAATRPLGALRIIEESGVAAIDDQLKCGKDVPVKTAAGDARMRQCHDHALGIDTVRLDVPLGKRRLIGSADPGLLGPLEEGMAILAGKRAVDQAAGREVASTLDYEAAGKAPIDDTVDVAAVGIFDPDAMLARGISLNRRGLHVEASRVLNDALSRIPANADAALRVQLLLEAGLADSNISFASSAESHFKEAQGLMSQVPDTQSAFLMRKQGTYKALDLLNRRQFGPAIEALDEMEKHGGGTQAPLLDVVTMRGLNQGSVSRDAATAIAVPNADELVGLVLDAQASWARSVAQLSKSKPDLGRVIL